MTQAVMIAFEMLVYLHTGKEGDEQNTFSALPVAEQKQLEELAQYFFPSQ